MHKLTESTEWKALQSHYDKVQSLHMRDLFAEDGERFNKFSTQACGILLDYSKNRITDETMSALFALAKMTNISGEAAKMFAGERINTTEDRSVLHAALRMPKGSTLTVDNEEVVSQVHAVSDHCLLYTSPSPRDATLSRMPSSA